MKAAELRNKLIQLGVRKIKFTSTKAQALEYVKTNFYALIFIDLDSQMDCIEDIRTAIVQKMVINEDRLAMTDCNPRSMFIGLTEQAITNETDDAQFDRVLDLEDTSFNDDLKEIVRYTKFV